MKRFYTLIISLGLLFGSFGVATAVTVFNSNQVGASPSNGYILQTNGTVSTWVANTAGGGGSGNVSTSTAETGGSLAYWTSNGATPALLGKVATTAIAVTAPITFSGTLGSQVGGAAGNFGCTSASAGVTGCMTAIDWGLLHTATTTFSSPLVYTGSTNAVTCPTCGTGSSNFGATSTNPFMATYYVATSTLIASQLPYASTTALSATTLCLTGDACRNSWPSASVSGGTAGMLTSWVNATTLTATSTPTASAYIATSTTATSTFAGPVRVNGNFFHVGSSTASSGDCFNNAAVCAEIIGQDNTDKGVSLIIQNTTAGGNSYGDIFMQNDNGNGLLNYGLINLNSSVFNNFSSWGTGFSSPNQLVFQNTFGPLTVGASGAGQYINFITNGTASSNEVMRMLSGGYITMGTTTSKLGVLTVGTSTAPQLVLSDNNPASNLWTMRSINNTLFIATSTATATSSVPAIQIQSGRGLAVGTSTSVGIMNLGFNAGSSASSTVIMEKIQFQGKDAAGNMRCVFLDVGGNLAVGASGVACTN